MIMLVMTLLYIMLQTMISSQTIPSAPFIYSFPFSIFATAFSNNQQLPLNLVVGSYSSTNNSAQILQVEGSGKIIEKEMVQHRFPFTKILFHPSMNSSLHLLATSSDTLQLWKYNEEMKVQMFHEFSKKEEKLSIPITSFDWNFLGEKIVTSSIDRKCRVFDIEKQSKIHEFVAHNKEVFNISFSNLDEKIFVTGGADNKINFYDLRQLQNPTTCVKRGNPISNVKFGKGSENNSIAILETKAKYVVLYDTRKLSLPKVHFVDEDEINDMDWQENGNLVTGGNSKKMFVWNRKTSFVNPILYYCTENSISSLKCSKDWISIGYDDKLQILKNQPVIK